jgi:NADPH2:quinone reductase
MLAALYDAPGDSSVLRVEEVEAPAPGPGEVRVRLRLAGVNPTDWKSRSRTQPAFAFQVPGQDGVGEIDAVGAGVDGGRVEERVWVYFAARERQWGSAAQYTVVPAAHAVPLPEGVSDELCASLGIPAMTAHRCLFADGPVAGRAVLVAGGAGAVGHFAIELARWAGARVVATVSSEEKARLAREAGAQEVVNYREDGAAEAIRRFAPEGVERVVEVALGHNLELDLAAAAPHAAIATYADDEVRNLPVRRLMTANLVLRFVLVYGVPRPALDAAAGDITRALRDRALSELPPVRFPLARIADAHDAVQDGAVGKVLLDVP